MPGGSRDHRPGLRVRTDTGARRGDDRRGVAVTTPLRTAFDLGRRTPLVEAVVAVDALTHAHRFAPSDVVTFSYRRLGARGSAQLPEVARPANPLAESPMATRVRLAIHADGLAPPLLQHPVGPYRLDMAYPDIRLAVEYDGREHLNQERALRDLDRQAYLSRAGWDVLRFRAFVVLHRPRRVAADVRRALMIAAKPV